MKTAQQAGPKWSQNTSGAGQAYHDGATGTTKDQSGAAIAAKAVWQAALTAAFGKDSYAKGLAKSGKQGWLDGVVQKGVAAFTNGVTAAKSVSKYVTNSGKYDNARQQASGSPRGPKGSPQNLQRVTLVANALHALKSGS